MHPTHHRDIDMMTRSTRSTASIRYSHDTLNSDDGETSTGNITSGLNDLSEDTEQPICTSLPLANPDSERHGPRPNQTIVLVGLPGAGKKTLGLIAAIALRRRFISFEQRFEQHTGSSLSHYISLHGPNAYQDVETKLVSELLSQNSTGSVIAGLGIMPNSRLRTTLVRFSKQYLVIYIRRARNDLIHNFNRSSKHFERLFDASNAFYESCSAFEFYNCTELLVSNHSINVQQELLLKYVERNFLRFLHHLMGVAQTRLFSRAPFSPSYTYALQVPLTWLEGPEPDYALLELGADAVSLVIDLGSEKLHDLQERISHQVSILRRHTRASLIVDVRQCSDRFSQYLGILRSSLRLSPDMMTVSLIHENDSIDAIIKSKGNTKIIGTHDHMTPRIDGWDNTNVRRICDQARFRGCDAIRITHRSSSIRANFQWISIIHNELERLDFPMTCYDDENLGRLSVCFNPILSPVALPTMGLRGLTLAEASRATFASFILPKKKFSIFGKSVSYTLSPTMHNAAYESCGMPHVYSFVQSSSFEDIKPLLSDEEYGGIAVSLPYKTDILPLLHELSVDAKHIQAVNTVVIDRRTRHDGSCQTALKGYNTDFIGIQECVHQNLSPANAIREGSTALIIGAGGMARAAIYACHKLGIKRVCIYNRTYKHAQNLAAYYHQWIKTVPQGQLNVRQLASLDDDWPQNFRQPTVIISCIPAHQIDYRAPATFTIPEKWLQSRSGGVFVELAYEPRETILMKQMWQKKSRAWIVVDGIEVLIKQAIAQFELFTGRPAPIHVMRDAARTHLGQI